MGVRLGPAGVEVMAPLGLADLLGLVLRPTPAFARPERHAAFVARAAAKGWTRRWPGLRVAEGEGPACGADPFRGSADHGVSGPVRWDGWAAGRRP